jgi:BMFP domain-containing protein YqiC
MANPQYRDSQEPRSVLADACHGTDKEISMPTENRFFEDLAKVANGAWGSLASLGSEMENRMRDQIERMLTRMDLVRREEFDAVRELAAKTRADQEAMAARLATVEAELAVLRHARGASPSLDDSSPTIG